MGFEPTTSCLGSKNSTAELHPLGVGIGVAIGAALDAKTKKEGRVICPSEKTTSSQTSKVLVAIGLGVLLLAGLIAFILFKLSA